MSGFDAARFVLGIGARTSRLRGAGPLGGFLPSDEHAKDEKDARQHTPHACRCVSEALPNCDTARYGVRYCNMVREGTSCVSFLWKIFFHQQKMMGQVGAPTSTVNSRCSSFRVGRKRIGFDPSKSIDVNSWLDLGPGKRALRMRAWRSFVACSNLWILKLGRSDQNTGCEVRLFCSP